MRIGCSVPMAFAGLAREIGFDFVELRVGELDPEGTDKKFAETARRFERAGIAAETWAFLLPVDMKVVGPAVDLERARRWVGTATRRAATLGGRLIVVGSGDARRIPDGFPREAARRQFSTFLVAAVDEASKAGVSLALEALNRTETNFIHSLAAATSLVDEIDHPGLGVVADIYHMLVESEPYRHLCIPGERLLHVQLADQRRRPPGTGGLDFGTVFTHLNAAGYQGRLAVEASFADFSREGGPSLEFIRHASQVTGALTFAAGV